ncbi:MAG: hypothetical protein PCFJNLEI_01826 [Verrucomicrobiae bacterium]|nr:hypothetical protein [Verrucomicrobiae bacterium]
MKARIVTEDSLKHLYDAEYRRQPATAQSLAGTIGVNLDTAAQVLSELEATGLATAKDGGYRLTDRGREYAVRVTRAHRLYETYLAETGRREEQWHAAAEQMEHKITGEKLDRLSRQLGEPRFDPHGDPIPTATGELPPLRGAPLTECPAGWAGQVVHIEDEPQAGYAEVIAAGVAFGTRLRVEMADERSVHIDVEGRHIELSRLAAGHVTVAEAREAFDETVMRLSTLRVGERGSVLGLSPACRGPERNRLLDLGVVPGTVVEIDIVSPAGNPVAYFIRGASIALRNEQADKILIKKL